MRWASSEALVVHGSGLDEVALHAETRGVRLSNGGESRSWRSRRKTPGLNALRSRSSPAATPDENAARLQALARRSRRAGRGGHRRAQCRRAAPHGGQSCGLARQGAADGPRGAAFRRGGASARTVHRGEPWLTEAARRDRRGEARRACAALRRRVARRAARAAQPTDAQPGGRAWPSRARASSSRSRRRRPLRARSARTPTRRALARGYAGVADALSVLTDRAYFGGSLDDLAAARRRIRRADPRQGLLHRSAPGGRGADCRRRRGAGDAVAARR